MASNNAPPSADSDAAEACTHVDLTIGTARAVFDLAAGGRLASLTVGGQQLLADRGQPAADTGIGWGAYVMAPWAGRLRNGQFRFGETLHELECNHVDTRPARTDGSTLSPAALRHAIHGTVTGSLWTLESVHTNRGEPAASHAAMSCRLDHDGTWPFPGTVRSDVTLTAHALRWTVEVASAGARFPAVIGWHPWFAKPETLEFTPSGMFRRDEAGIPTGAIRAPTDGPWDDCFINSDPVTLCYDRLAAPVVTVSSDCGFWVVYDEPADATCVEPQSGPPDAFNLRDFPPHVVDEGSPLRRTMEISW